MRSFVMLCCLLIFCMTTSKAACFDHNIFDSLLNAHVYTFDGGKSSRVDYLGFAKSRLQLDEYLRQLTAVTMKDFDAWPKSEQLAFLINAYNAWTIQLVLSKYPDLKSIKDLGNIFQSPWQKNFIPLLGELRSLDGIEHGLIRGSDRYKDPRVHFALNCASIGCPALRTRAYQGDLLESQLTEAMVAFLQDRSRNRLRGTTLEVSMIFKWYQTDFSSGWRSYTSLATFFADQTGALAITRDEAQSIRDGKIGIEFLPYDWRLNDYVGVQQ